MKARLRVVSVGSLAGQVLRDRASLRSGVSGSASGSHAPGILSELGLSTSGGTGVLVSDNPVTAARAARLALDDDGDVVVLRGREDQRPVLEALALFAYGDTRENAAAAAWITRRQAAL